MTDTNRDQELATIQRTITAATAIDGLTNDEVDALIRAAAAIRRLRIREMTQEGN